MMTDLENRMFWIPYFGVRIVQDKSYKHDQIEEGTAQQIRINNLTASMDQLNAYGMRLNVQKILDTYNNVDTNLDLSDIEDKPLLSSPSSTMNNRLSNETAMNSGMSRSDRAEKRQEELVRERTDGKPNGVSR
jgi:hypothetical protein